MLAGNFVHVPWNFCSCSLEILSIYPEFFNRQAGLRRMLAEKANGRHAISKENLWEGGKRGGERRDRGGRERQEQEGRGGGWTVGHGRSGEGEEAEIGGMGEMEIGGEMGT